MYVSVKLPTHPSPNLTFCQKREVSVNVRFGEGWVGSSQKHTLIQGFLLNKLFIVHRGHKNKEETQEEQS